MAYRCENCNKGVMIGRQHKHHPGVAGGRWKRRAPKTQKIFKPNLHWSRISIDGFMKRIKLCTKCLRLARDTMKVKKTVKIESPIPAQKVMTA